MKGTSSPTKEDATSMHQFSKQQLKKVDNVANNNDSSSFSSSPIDHLKQQLEEKDKIIASLRKSVEVI